MLKEGRGDEDLETETLKKNRLTFILTIAAGAAAVLLIVMVLLSIPYFGGEAEPTVPTAMPTEAPTQAPTEPPTEPEPTLPPPEANPYGQLDFQYDGRYLKCLRTESVTGIDVSSHQGDIDWAQVKASGVDFAIIRIGYRGYESGKIGTDEYAEANLTGALEAGLDVGVYFFSQALTLEEVTEEVDFVLDFIKDYEITMPVVYDWEFVNSEARTADMDARTLTDCSLAFLEAIQVAGYEPMLYFNTYQSQNLLHLEELKEFDFWLAMYSSRMDYPYKLKMWQYTNEGSVPGIQGNTDINIYFPEG